MPNSFELLVWSDQHKQASMGRSALILEVEKLSFPEWADSYNISTVFSETKKFDAVILLISDKPSARSRLVFFSLFRKGIPIGALVQGEPSFSDPIFSKLNSWNRCWAVDSHIQLVSFLHTQVQEWLLTLNRDLMNYPSGNDLIESWGDVAGSSIDSKYLVEAYEVLSSRGFVCIAGPPGAGKTTLARLLLMKSADEGLVPFELIAQDIKSSQVELKLRGPDDCIILFDIDSIRRSSLFVPLHLFLSAFTVILKSTDTRRRVVLTSSDPRISGLFELFGEAFIELPSPETNRQWRFEEGQKALETFRGLDLLNKVEFVLLSLFEPIVSEDVFKTSLMEIWSRLYFLLHEGFPSEETLTEMYSRSNANLAVSPFRRLNMNNEVFLCSGDTILLEAVDKGMAELSSAGSPLIRVVMETLLNSKMAEQRRAGYSIAHMYKHLSSTEKSRLLFTASRETQSEVLIGFTGMLLADKESFDRSAEGFVRYIMVSGSAGSKRALAASLGIPWLRRDHYFRDIVETISKDSDDRVRAALLMSIDSWGNCKDDYGIINRLLDDKSVTVFRVIMFFLGHKFPNLNRMELTIVNDALTRGNNDELRGLVFGLMNRQLSDFDEESCDLLWLLMQRLPDGGRGLVANNIGARIRFFGHTIRDSLFTDVSEADIRPISQCLLMNYADLYEEEKSILWNMISEKMPQSIEMSKMVLPYIKILEDSNQQLLIKIVLSSDQYGAREALSQLLAGGRTDLIELVESEVSEMINAGTTEEKSRLSWFLLWNFESFEDAPKYLNILLDDNDDTVRKALAFSIKRLGLVDSYSISLLMELSFDKKRSVRAAAAEALAEFSTTGTISERVLALSTDSEPTVRTATLFGISKSTHLDFKTKADFYVFLLDDPEQSVRLQALKSIEKLNNLGSVSGLVEKMTLLLSDRSEKVRSAAVHIVTNHPSISRSRELREKLPDLYLGRLIGGDSIAEELNTARQIQIGLLPKEAPKYEHYSIAVYYNPAKEVGGDYFDFFNLPDGNVGIAVADVAGKGIPAALTMAGLKGTLGASVRSVFDITQIMSKVNSELTVEAGVSGMVGLFYSVLDTKNSLLTYCNAGHNPPMLVSRDGATSFLEEGGLLMGVMDNAIYSSGTTNLYSGDVLVLYTDGITETMNSNDEEFDVAGLQNVIMEFRDLSAQQIINRILKAVEIHGQGTVQADDRTLVVIKRR